jgi:tetratricopeptide (TPR) repeat protein
MKARFALAGIGMVTSALLQTASVAAATPTPSVPSSPASANGGVAPAGASEASREEGRVRFRRGVEFYKEGNYHAALAEFRVAYEVAPSSRIQYNLGQTLFQLQDYAGALTAFEAYVADNRESGGEDRAREVDADIAKLRPRVAVIQIVTNIPASGLASATVLVDDEPREFATTGVRVSAGRRKIAVTANGFQTETRILDVAGSTATELRFELKPTSDSRDTESAGNSSSGSRLPFYVGLSVTGVFTASAVTFAVLSNSKFRAWENLSTVPDANRGEIDDLRSSTKNFALTADILAGASVAAGLLTVGLYFASSGGATSEPQARTRSSKLRIAPLVAPQAVGVFGVF